MTSQELIEDIIYELWRNYKDYRGLTRSEELLTSDFGDYIIHNWKYYQEKVKKNEL